MAKKEYLKPKSKLAEFVAAKMAKHIKSKQIERTCPSCGCSEQVIGGYQEKTINDPVLSDKFYSHEGGALSWVVLVQRFCGFCGFSRQEFVEHSKWLSKTHVFEDDIVDSKKEQTLFGPQNYGTTSPSVFDIGPGVLETKSSKKKNSILAPKYTEDDFMDDEEEDEGKPVKIVKLKNIVDEFSIKPKRKYTKKPKLGPLEKSVRHVDLDLEDVKWFEKNDKGDITWKKKRKYTKKEHAVDKIK